MASPQTQATAPTPDSRADRWLIEARAKKDFVPIVVPPIPPYTAKTARQKMKAAQAKWNATAPHIISQAYTPDSAWRVRNEFFSGTAAIEAFLTRKWETEFNYRMRREVFAFNEDRIATEFWYEYSETEDPASQWHRVYGLEHGVFAPDGRIISRHVSANTIEIANEERWFKDGVAVESFDVPRGHGSARLPDSAIITTAPTPDSRVDCRLIESRAKMHFVSTVPPIPPYTAKTARQKMKAAQAKWNAAATHIISQAYTADSAWRVRNEFFSGTAAIEAFLTRKWEKEFNYRMRREIFAFGEDRIATELWYEYSETEDPASQWYRVYGLEHGVFAPDGRIISRHVSANTIEIANEERWFKDGVAVESFDIPRGHGSARLPDSAK